MSVLVPQTLKPMIIALYLRVLRAECGARDGECPSKNRVEMEPSLETDSHEF